MSKHHTPRWAKTRIQVANSDLVPVETKRRRREVLLSLDKRRILDHIVKVGARIPLPVLEGDDELFWCMVHKSICALDDVTDAEKAPSRAWLAEYGYSEMER